MLIAEILAAVGITQGWIVAGAILASFIVLAAVVSLLWVNLLRPVVNRINTSLADVLLSPLRKTVVWGIVLLGLSEAFKVVPLPESLIKYHSWFGRLMAILWVSVLTWQSVALSNNLFHWYYLRQSRHKDPASDTRSKLILIRKITNTVLATIGILLALVAADVDISPLLAGGAIGGIVIGLALQDTLSNLFAGLYMAFDRPIRVGDFIKLEDGQEGYVEEIGWRNTRVRMMSNDMVMLPNSRLSQSTITNFYLPKNDTSVLVYCGVSYDSDLQRVEDVAVEVGQEVQNRIPGAQKDWTPLVRWQEFADSSVNFMVIIRVVEHDQKWLLKSEFIKALHKRFAEEGIEIPFPIRTTILKPGTDRAIPVQVHLDRQEHNGGESVDAKARQAEGEATEA